MSEGRTVMTEDTNGITPEEKPVVVKLYDYRHHCGRLLFRAYLPDNSLIEIRCPKCGGMYKYGGNNNSVPKAEVIEQSTGDDVI